MILGVQENNGENGDKPPIKMIDFDKIKFHNSRLGASHNCN